MVELPNTLEEAIAQARQATLAALADGNKRISVDLVFPEIALQAQSIAQQFIPIFEDRISQVKVFFPDAGSAALARRDWGEIPFKIEDIGLGRSPIEKKIDPEDEIFLLVDASGVEVAEVEKICNAAGERPVILLIPHMEDLVGAVGIGLAGRRLRERFLTTIGSCYYIRPLAGAAIFRNYPGPWQVLLQKGEDYEVIAELPRRPVGEEIDQILMQTIEPSNTETPNAPRPKKPGLFATMQQFLKALNN